jgi:CMP-2-keto-3-deoxyoctulosonic acid synthetase
MSIKEHESGVIRIAEAIENLDVDIVNVQGDEPFIMLIHCKNPSFKRM